LAKIKVVIYGCGVIGRKVVEALLDKEVLRLSVLLILILKL